MLYFQQIIQRNESMIMSKGLLNDILCFNVAQIRKPLPELFPYMAVGQAISYKTNCTRE